MILISELKKYTEEGLHITCFKKANGEWDILARKLCPAFPLRSAMSFHNQDYDQRRKSLREGYEWSMSNSAIITLENHPTWPCVQWIGRKPLFRIKLRSLDFCEVDRKNRLVQKVIGEIRGVYVKEEKNKKYLRLGGRVIWY